ncbi:MAG: hypothetical protein WEB53_09105 [Akkermansiaceae bacterium]
MSSLTDAQSEWDPFNPVIAMDVLGRGERCWANNTQPTIRGEAFALSFAIF